MFDPQQFFEHTAHYASQGRNEFKLLRLPRVFSLNDPLISEAWEMLSTGIVAKDTTLPGQSLATYEHTYMGPTTKIPYGQIFSDIDVEFLLMGRTIEYARSLRHFFVRWQELIAGFTPTSTVAARNPIANHSLFGADYFVNYVTEATMTIYSPATDNALRRVPIVRAEYIDLYPTTIGPMQTSWESPDAPLSMAVTFTYFHTRSSVPTN